MTVVSRTLTRALNVCSRTIVDGVPTLTATTAANRMAGTSGLHLVGALNKWAGTSGRDIGHCLNVLANTSGLGVDEAASRLAANYEGQLLYDAAWYVDALYSDGGQTVSNLGTGGSVLNATLGSSASADSNDPKFLAYEGTPYVYLPGVGGNYLSVPDENALDITGDIDIRVRVAMDSWKPATYSTLLGKDDFSAGRSYTFGVVNNATGRLYMVWTANGSTAIYKESTASVPADNGSPIWVRATLDVDNGATANDLKFWTSPDGVSWTQLGNTVTTSGVTSIFASATSLKIGANAAGSTEPAAGKFYRAQVLNGIDGTTVLDVDCSKITSGSATSFTATSGQTVTVNRSESGRKAVAVVGPLWLLGTDDYLEVADNDLLNFGATDSFTVVGVSRQWASLEGTIVGKYGAATTTGWYLVNPASNYIQATIRQSGNRVDRDAQSPRISGEFVVSGMVVDRGANTLASFTRGAVGQSTSAATVGSLANSSSMRVGALNAGTYLAGEFIAAAVFRRVLTAAEIAAITSYYQSRYA